MLNTKFVIHSIIKIKFKIKSYLINFKDNYLREPKFNFQSSTKITSAIYQYRFNMFLFIFLLATVYHFFFLSLANQNILCLIYLTLGATIYLFFSGFIYFIKLYAYNRFTGFIQDF